MDTLEISNYVRNKLFPDFTTKTIAKKEVKQLRRKQIKIESLYDWFEKLTNQPPRKCKIEN